MAEFLDYPLVAPLDEGQDERSLDSAPRLAVAENARVVSGHVGQVSPRSGTEQIGDQSIFTWPSVIFEHGGQLVAVQEGSGFGLAPDGSWEHYGYLSRLRIAEHRDVFGGDAQADPQSPHVERGVGVGSAACALAGGVTFTVYHVAADRFAPVGAEGIIWCQVNVGGRLETIRIADIAAGSPQPHVEVDAYVDGGTVYALVAWGQQDSTFFEIATRLIEVSSDGSVTAGAQHTMVSLGSTTPSPYIWSMCLLGSTWYFALAFGSTTDLWVFGRTVSNLWVGEVFATTSATGGHRHVAIAPVASAGQLHVWVAENSGNDVSLVIVPSDLSGVTDTDALVLANGTQSLGIAAVEVFGSRSFCLLNRATSGAAGCTAFLGDLSAGIIGAYPTNGDATDVLPFRVGSKMWRVGSTVNFLAVCGPASAVGDQLVEQATMGQAVVSMSADMSRWTSSDPYEILDSGVIPHLLYSQGDVPVVGVVPVGVGVSGSEVVMPIIRRRKLPVRYINGYAGLGLEEVRLRTDRRRYTSAILHGKHYLAGGQLTCFDGWQFAEMGYSHLPYLWSGNILSGTDGNLELGTYLVGWGWEWADSHGDAHASAVQLATITLDDAGEDEIQLTFQQVPIPVSLKGSQANSRPVQLVTYLSEPNGTTLYRNISYPLPAGMFGVFTISLTDVFPDAEVCPYTDAGRGELQPFPPPPCTVICAHQGRLYVVPDNDPVRIWYSKPHQANRAPEFSPELNIYVGEPVTSLASSDGNLVVFTDNNTYSLAVIPGNERGVGAGPNEPLLITAGRGCIDHRATISTPAGVFYRSRSGLSVLPRGGVDAMSVTQIDRTLQQYPDIVAAAILPGSDAVAFALLDDGESSAATGPVAVYDYHVGQWFIWWYPSAVHSLGQYRDRLTIGVFSAVGMAVHGENDSGQDWDDSQVEVTLETQDIRVGGAAGLARVARATVLGERLGEATLTIAESLDSGSTWATPASWTLDDPSEVEVYRRRTLVRQKAVRVRLRITTQATSGDGLACALNAIKLEVQPIRGAVRLPAGSRG